MGDHAGDMTQRHEKHKLRRIEQQKERIKNKNEMADEPKFPTRSI